MSGEVTARDHVCGADADEALGRVLECPSAAASMFSWRRWKASTAERRQQASGIAEVVRGRGVGHAGPPWPPRAG